MNKLPFKLVSEVFNQAIVSISIQNDKHIEIYTTTLFLSFSIELSEKTFHPNCYIIHSIYSNNLLTHV